LPALAAEEQVVGLDPAEQEVAVDVPGEADAAVDLDVLGGDQGGRLRHHRLGDGGRRLALGVVHRAGPGGVVGGDPGQLQLVEHVDDLVPDHLERGDGPVELDPLPGVVGRHGQGPLARAHALGAQGDPDVVHDAGPEGALVAGRAEAAGRAAVQGQAGNGAGDV
jgi:hypothetical protein